MNRHHLALLALMWVASLTSGCDSTCDRYCRAAVGCTEPWGNCVPIDVDAALSACVDACQVGLEASPGAAECLNCLGDSAPYACAEERFICPPCNGQEFYEAYGPYYWEGFYSEAREDAFLCTNGGNVWGNSCYWDDLDWDAQYCDLSCWSGWTGVNKDPVAVSAECAGPPEGPISCTCTVGKNAGQVFELSDCGDIIWDEALWDPCNL